MFRRRNKIPALIAAFMVGGLSGILAHGSDKLEKDWLFQADNAPTLTKIQNEIKWTRELAGRISKLDGAPDLSGDLKAVAEIEQALSEKGSDAIVISKAVLKRTYNGRNKVLKGKVNELDVTARFKSRLRGTQANLGNYLTLGNPDKGMKLGKNEQREWNWHAKTMLHLSYTLNGTSKQAVFKSGENIDLGSHLAEEYLALRKVKRAITFKNPIVNFDKVLLIDNPYPGGPGYKYESNHECRHRNGWMANNGGRLLITQGLDPDSDVIDFKVEEKRGSFWRPDLSFNGEKVVFSYKPAGEKSFHLYTANADGSDIKQITFGDYDDLDPIWLPDGHISFSTSRAGTYVRCMPQTHVFVLARCEADGKNIYVVSRNNEPDFLPSVMDDGRVIYTRWEYTDKGLWRAQSLWTMNPDGTNVNVFWGNQSVYPDMLIEPRQIPGSNRVMFTGVGHHRWFAGSIGIIDPKEGLNFPDGITKVTQDVRWPETGDGKVDPKENNNYHRSGNFTAYKTPYPLSEEYFLVSARTGSEGGPRGSAAPELFSLYLMDVYGNKELIYKGKYNAYHAMPAIARKKPRVIPDVVAWPEIGEDYKGTKPGVLYSSNVLEGTTIPKEKAKYLRVIEQDPKTYTTWDKTVQHDGPAVAIHGPDPVKRILGTVPIEEDGSVNFELPAGKGVYLQILDKDFRAVQTQRSFTGVMPGETRGCVGCHEQQNTAPQSGGLALRKAPAKLTLPPWGEQTVGYNRFVQPTLDKYCGECHQGDKNSKAKKALDMTYRFSSKKWGNNTMQHRPGDESPFPEPYLTLAGGSHVWSHRYKDGKLGVSIGKGESKIPTSMAGMLLHEGFYGNDVKGLITLPPMSMFTYKSKLYDYATSGKHHKVKIDKESERKLIAWIDTNGPFLGVEEIRDMYDPIFGRMVHVKHDPNFNMMDHIAVRPRIATAPVIDRFNIRQDGDSDAVAGNKELKLYTPKPIAISIIKAVYGSDKKNLDVSAKLAKLSKKNDGGMLDVGDYNTVFGGDPHPGVAKKLTVTYTTNGKESTKVFKEGSELNLK